MLVSTFGRFTEFNRRDIAFECYFARSRYIGGNTYDLPSAFSEYKPSIRAKKLTSFNASIFYEVSAGKKENHEKVRETSAHVREGGKFENRHYWPITLPLSIYCFRSAVCHVITNPFRKINAHGHGYHLLDVEKLKLMCNGMNAIFRIWTQLYISYSDHSVRMRIHAFFVLIF